MILPLSREASQSIYFVWTLLLAFRSARRSDGTPAAPAPAPHGILKKREAELDDG